MIKHTASLYKGYLSKESDEVLHQLALPPQSPDLNPIEMSWTTELRKSSQQVLSICGNCVGKAFQVSGLENAKSVQSCHQGKGWLLT